MSRNPYLAASRPTSSFTRSSRTSKRSDLSSTGRPGFGSGAGGGLLGRSRSSATLGGGLSSSQYNAASSYSSSSYVPSSSWQRSSSSTRLNSSSISARPSASDNSSSNNYASSSSRNDHPSLYKSTSSHDIISRTRTDPEDQDGSLEYNDHSTSHLKNYQQSKLQQQTTSPAATRIRSSLQSLDLDTNTDYSKRSTTSLDSSITDVTSYDEPIGDSIPSGSARRLAKSQGQLLKSQSLDISRQQQQQQQLDNDNNTTQFLSSSMSVDRLLLRAESMGERDLRKSFKELVMENERLKRQLIGIDEKDKIRQQDWIRKERQLQRKISELEEENKQLEQWKLELQRLKDENSSLIRVVSKLSKKQ